MPSSWSSYPRDALRGNGGCTFHAGRALSPGPQSRDQHLSLGVASVTLVTVLMLGLVFVTSIVDRNFSRQTLALEGSEQRYRLIVESTFDAFIALGFRPNYRLEHPGRVDVRLEPR